MSAPCGCPTSWRPAGDDATYERRIAGLPDAGDFHVTPDDEAHVFLAGQWLTWHLAL